MIYIPLERSIITVEWARRYSGSQSPHGGFNPIAVRSYPETSAFAPLHKMYLEGAKKGRVADKCALVWVQP